MNKCNIKEPDCYKAVFYFDFSATLKQVTVCGVGCTCSCICRGVGRVGTGASFRVGQGNANFAISVFTLEQQ